MESTALYLYAICDSDVVSVASDDLEGLFNEPVRTIESGGLFAVVSAAPEGSLRPTRRHLAAHQGVVRALVESGTVLPMSFGMVCDDESQVTGFLTENQANLAEQVAFLDGRCEMGVRVAWDVEDVYEHVLTLEPELKAERDRLKAMGDAVPRDERIAFGQQFEATMTAHRNHVESQVQQALVLLAVDHVFSSPRSDQEIVNHAYLVARDTVERFEDKVIELAGGWDATLSVDLSGPWPAYSFVNQLAHQRRAA